jgi:hypothetical protein
MYDQFCSIFRKKGILNRLLGTQLDLKNKRTITAWCSFLVSLEKIFRSLALIIVEKDEIPIVQCRTPLASWF